MGVGEGRAYCSTSLQPRFRGISFSFLFLFLIEKGDALCRRSGLKRQTRLHREVVWQKLGGGKEIRIYDNCSLGFPRIEGLMTRLLRPPSCFFAYISRNRPDSLLTEPNAQRVRVKVYICLYLLFLSSRWIQQIACCMKFVLAECGKMRILCCNVSDEVSSSVPDNLKIFYDDGRQH